MRNALRRSSDTPDLGVKPIPLAGESGDGRYLYEVELMARGYTALGLGWLSLDLDLVLPDFAEPAKKAGGIGQDHGRNRLNKI